MAKFLCPAVLLSESPSTAKPFGRMQKEEDEDEEWSWTKFVKAENSYLTKEKERVDWNNFIPWGQYVHTQRSLLAMPSLKYPE